MKVLVAIPVKQGMLYRQALNSVLSLDWSERLDVIYLVSGDNEPFYWSNQLTKLNQAREVALNGGYDALYTIDSDIKVPTDALVKMVAVDADVVYGLIVLRQPCRDSVDHPWNVNTSLIEGKMTFLSDDKEAARAAWGKVIPSMGHGQAICLIHRQVLERIPFRTPNPQYYAADWYLSIDCQREGFTQKHHLGVACGHIDPDPLKIYWPDPDEEKLYRVEMIAEHPTPHYQTRDDSMIPFYGQFVKAGDLVFNIGANVGIRTPVFLNLGARVVAVEPQPDLCEILRSKFGHEAIIIEALAGAKEGTGELLLCSQDQLATCSKAWADSLDDRWPADKWNRKITVPMITLDGLIQQYGMPDFTKIDVEGYEIEVLKGLTHPLKALCFEFTITYLEPVMECLDRLVGLGMRRFNYIVRDEMKFCLPEWIGAEEMKAVLKALPIETFFGDIFALPGEET